mgnify:CR=1 FL=1
MLANPPFNISDWWHASLTGDARWHYGDPPQGNANYAWLQHMLHHLKPGGRAGLVLRAIGESPESAHALGYKVRWIRLGAVVAGGALCALAGLRAAQALGRPEPPYRPVTRARACSTWQVAAVVRSARIRGRLRAAV